MSARFAAQREALHRLRAEGEISDEAFRRIQEETRLVRARRRAGRKFSIAGELRRAIVLSVRALEAAVEARFDAESSEHES